MNTVSLKASDPMAQALRKAMDSKARVNVIVSGGTSVSGHISDVGDSQVVVAELVGKDFFDALVPISAICALEFQARSV